jgi:alkanesulfonate monooxygenase SsuD/methylene tetrahydromethanopterin reductase-like flavin-dependent oxidoreductase (luciferase family)
MQISIMVEGHLGLNWGLWKALVLEVERLGFAGLYRSDHYINPDQPEQDSLELWTSLTWLACNTTRLRFGPIVCPLSFREPTSTARVAAALHELSSGRFTLGLGAGWMEAEHRMFGFSLLPVEERFRRFEEGLEVITRLLHEDGRVNFAGEFYRLENAWLRPFPDGPPLLVGGNGPKRTLPLAARYAQEWNGVYLTPSAFAERCSKLDELAGGRTLRRSLMTGVIFGATESALQRNLGQDDAEDVRRRGAVAGTPTQVCEQLQAYAQAGVEEIMLQWLDLEDLAGLEQLREAVQPVISG